MNGRAEYKVVTQWLNLKQDIYSLIFSAKLKQSYGENEVICLQFSELHKKLQLKLEPKVLQLSLVSKHMLLLVNSHDSRC